MKYGRLTIIGKEGLSKTKHKCLCDCGNIHYATLNAMRSGGTMSCGCLNRELASARFKKHGMRFKPEYTAWQLMKDRCTNPNSGCFSYYGGRGITVCARWFGDFRNFLADMGMRPSSKHTLDRIDGNGNYEPGNCRWATRKEQSRNRSNTQLVTFRDQTKSLGEWCEILQIDYNNTNKRLWRGWSVIRAFTEPKQARYL